MGEPALRRAALEKPKRRATASSWILFSELCAVL
jgi:hypothetical protein